jgi:hypothetical protein
MPQHRKKLVYFLEHSRFQTPLHHHAEIAQKSHVSQKTQQNWGLREP